MSADKKTIVSVNTLKNWFKRGLKPNQEQFWLWMDAYWHKEEPIAQDKIKNLNETLSKKVEVSDLNEKANNDASGLTEENIKSWKQALQVWQLPSNMATIDKDDVLGNVNTKEQITFLLESKLSIPETEGNTTTHPYVIGIDNENVPIKLSIGDLGKNIGNADLKVPEGQLRVLDVSQAKLQIKGLENKKADASYYLRIKVDDRGNIATSDEAEVQVRIPETMTYTNSLNFTMSQVEVNKVKILNSINNIANINKGTTPIFLRYMKTITDNLYTKIRTTEKWEFVNNTGFEGLVAWDNEQAVLKFNKATKRGDAINFSAILKEGFPMNKNWVLRFKINPFNSYRTDSVLDGNFLHFGFVTSILSTATYPSIGILKGVNNSYNGGYTVSEQSYSVNMASTLEIIYTKVASTLFLSVVLPEAGQNRTWAFDVSEITASSLFFVGSGKGSVWTQLQHQPVLSNFRFYIDDREINLDERIDNEQNIEKLNEFKEQVKTKELRKLSSSDWVVEKLLETGGNSSGIITNGIQLYKNVSGNNSNWNTVCSVAYTPDFKLPKEKNYYFKFIGQLRQGRQYNVGCGIIGFTNTKKTQPNLGTISNGTDSVNGMNVGDVLSDNQINSNGGKTYTSTTLEIWKVDKLVNIRLSQGVKQIYQILFDVDLVGDISPSSAYLTGKQNAKIAPLRIVLENIGLSSNET